jgi:broad specificity phosphatase PhoE
MTTDVATISRPITKFCFVPACDTDADANKLIPQQITSSLNATGKEQAAKIAKRLSSLSFSSIYCSNSPNALETAGAIRKGRECQVFSGKILREFNFGALAGRPDEEYRNILSRAIESQHYNTIEKRAFFRVAEGAENVMEAYSRVVSSLKEIASKNNEEYIIIVSHARLISAFVAGLFDRDIDAVKVEKNGVLMIAEHLGRFYFFDGKKISLSGKTAQEGLFDPAFLSDNIHEGWGAAADIFKDYSDEEVLASKQQFTRLADCHFRNNNNDTKIVEELALLCKSVITPGLKEKAKTLKELYYENLCNYEKTLFEKSSTEQPGYSKVLRDIIRPGAPHMNKLLLGLYEYGDTDSLSDYVLYLFNSFESMEERKSFVSEWAKKVFRDFQERKPISFPMMVKLLHERQISCVSIAGIPPFDNIEASLEILKKLSDIKVKGAEDALCWIYRGNRIGIDNNEVKLTLSREERLSGLKKLAERGNEDARIALRESYCANALDVETPCDFTKEERESGMKMFQENEKKSPFCAADAYWSNIVNGNPTKLRVKDRIKGLHDQSSSGDVQALSYLLCMYKRNALGDNPRISLGLSGQERLDKIEELVSVAMKNNFKLTDEIYNFFINMQKKNTLGKGENKISLNWTLEDRLERLEGLAEEFYAAEKVLIEAYRNNRLEKDSLNMAAEERLAKLHEFACRGADKAAWIVLNFYSDSNLKTESETIKDAHLISMDAETKRDRFNEVISEGENYGLGKRFLMMGEKDPDKETKQLLFSTLDMLQENLVNQSTV